MRGGRSSGRPEETKAHDAGMGDAPALLLAGEMEGGRKDKRVIIKTH